MAITYIIYAAALTYVLTVGVSLLVYGGVDYLRRSNRSDGAIELLAGATVTLYVAVVHFEGLTGAVSRELSHGSLVSKSYIVLPALVGLVSTDYVLRRVIPLLSALVASDDAGREGGAEPTVRGAIRSRRAVLGSTLGVVSASLLGGVSFLRDALGSPIPEGTDLSEFQLESSFEAPYFPTALDFDERGHGYLTNIEGTIFRFERPSAEQESIEFEQVASGIQSPQGIEVYGDTLYTVDNGDAASGKWGVEEGYEKLRESNGEVIAFDIESDGSLTNERTIISNLPVVNRDHALHQIVTGPDDRLYLSIGHLGGKKYPELFEDGSYEPSERDHPGFEYLGTVISFDPDGSDVEIVASGLRNVYDLTFDRRGNLFGANNDGMSLRSKVWESVCHITEGANFGYPEYGTFESAPGDTDVEDPLWTLDGVGSTGLEATDKLGDTDGVVVGLSGKVVFVPIEHGSNGVFVPEFLRPEPTIIELTGRPLIVEAGPDEGLWVGSTGREDRLSLYRQ
jgi:glucose/arabinose dehydrogenase